MDNDHITWAVNILSSSNYQLTSPTPEIIQNNPWSTVYRFKTNQGFIFLKKLPPALSLEPTVINILNEKFHANVPQIIAVNRDQNCFLMLDAGIQLHHYFKEKFQANVLIEFMKDYTNLQIKSLESIELFLDMGVPDWRLDKLPKLYQDLIAHEALLIEDGLSKEEIIKLKILEPKLNSICEKLSLYKIKDTFGHADFHDKNILINIHTNQTTLIDLGEVVITHPFFSFHNCLHRAKENFSLSDSQYQQLQLLCFEPWLALDTQEHLLEILAIIQQCWSIHGVLGEFRLMNSVDPIAFQKLHRQGRLAKSLRYWMN